MVSILLAWTASGSFSKWNIVSPLIDGVRLLKPALWNELGRVLKNMGIEEQGSMVYRDSSLHLGCQSTATTSIDCWLTYVRRYPPFLKVNVLGTQERKTSSYGERDTKHFLHHHTLFLSAHSRATATRCGTVTYQVGKRVEFGKGKINTRVWVHLVQLLSDFLEYSRVSMQVVHC
jgi:hypothetical protein